MRTGGVAGGPWWALASSDAGIDALLVPVGD